MRHRERSRRRGLVRSSAGLLVVLSLFAATSAFGTEASTRGWARRFDGPAHESEEPNDIAVDALGNIYVAGYSNNTEPVPEFLTVAYSPAGNLRWGRRFNPSGAWGVADAVEVAPSGTVYVAGTINDGGSRMTVVRYGSAGNRLWARRSTTRYGDVNALAVGAHERAFVTGSTWESGEQDVLTIAYSSSGRRLWTRTWDLRGLGDDRGVAVAADADGSAYVLARALCTPAATSCDFVILKYHPRGGVRWVRAWDGGYDDFPGDIGVDSAGNVYVSGGSENAAGTHDLVTFSYNANGRLRWEQRYDAPAEGDNRWGALEVTPDGVSYVAGTTHPPGGDDDIVTIRYGSRGRETWVRHYGTRTGDDEWASDLAVDAEGSVVVVGGEGSAWPHDAITIKYSRRGTLRWSRIFDRPEGEDSEAVAIAIDPTGWITVAGFTGELTLDLLTIHYGP